MQNSAWTQDLHQSGEKVRTTQLWRILMAMTSRMGLHQEQLVPFPGYVFLLQGKKTFSSPVCCHAVCKMFPMISEMVSLQELSPTFAPTGSSFQELKEFVFPGFPSQHKNIIWFLPNSPPVYSSLPYRKLVSEYDRHISTVVYECHTEGSAVFSQALLLPNFTPLLMIFFFLTGFATF